MALHNTGFLVLTTYEGENSLRSDAVTKSGKYFVYYGKDEASNCDKQNIQLFKMKTGLIKSEKQFGQVITEIDGKDGNITTKKFTELVKLNDATAQYFLKFLDTMLWEEKKLAGDGKILKDSIVSSIDGRDAIEILKPLIEEIGFINSYVLDMKYNPKITAADVSMKIQKLREDIWFNINPLKASKH